MSRPAVFLDRDGTIIDDVGFLGSVDAMTVLPWSAGAIRMLNEAGYPVVVVTNQSGVGRGLFDEARVKAIHEALDRTLGEQNARVDAYYYCPHHPRAADVRYRVSCECRKPAPGLLRQAASDLDLDLARSWMVGDWWRDVEAGVAAGARAILVRTGHHETHRPAPPAPPPVDAILDNLMEAVDWILRSSR